MSWNLPIAVEIGGKKYKIREKCDYRMVLDCIAALNDSDLEMQNAVECALIIFYQDFNSIEDIYKLSAEDFETAIKEMFKIINYGDEEETNQPQKPKLMDWEKDFKLIASSTSHILGYDIRTPNEYTHWWSFLGAYMEIGESTFSTVVSIRSKKMKGKKLEKYEEDFYRENRKLIDLPLQLTAEERALLESEW